MPRTLALLALLTLTALPTAAQAQSLSTIYATNNSQRGVMFDLEAKADVTIQSFDCNLDNGTHDVEVYTRTGTHIGATDDPGQWTLIGSTSVTSLGRDTATPIPLPINQPIATGQRRAFYITITTGGSVLYTNGAAGPTGPAGALYKEDANLRLFEGTGKDYPFATNFSPRIPNVTIAYTATLPPQPPTISAIANQTMNEDGSLTLNFTIADPDSDLNALVLAATSQNPARVSNAGLSLSGMDAARSLTITPELNANGVASISIRVTDEGGRSATRTFQLTISPVNDAPTFILAPPVMVLEDSGAGSIPSFARMISPGPADEASQTLTFTVTAARPELFDVQPAISPAGVLTFTIKPNVNGSSQLQVLLRDSGGVANNGKNTSVELLGAVEITPVNDPPVASPDMISTAEDTGLAIPVLTNDVDLDGDPLSVTVVTPPTRGMAVANLDGTISYLPAANYSGPDSLTYRITDPSGASSTAAVTINVTPVNDPPLPGDDDVTAPQNTAITIDALANDTDVEGSPLTLTAVTQPAHGVAALVAGSIRYTPTQGYLGPDQLTYTVSDGQASAQGTVNITVTRMNRAPVFVAPTPMSALTAAEGQRLTFTLAATDADLDALTYAVSPLPAGATLDATSGAFAWTPTWQQAGDLQLTLKATDGEAEATLALTISVTFTDGDDDGLPDSWESTRGLKTDSADSDGDTISDLEEVGPDLNAARDTDGDSVLDALELDSDNDNAPDAAEAGDADLATAPLDTDGDGRPDFRDVDSDDDNVPDVRDNCRLVDNFNQADSNGDGVGDACSQDTDGDGVPDGLEVALGLNPMSADSDGDTIPDGEELGSAAMPRDTDGDMTIDARDTDSDNDGLLDSEEAGDADPATPPRDTDRDNTPDYRDADSDNDMVDDLTDNCPLDRNRGQDDTDGDGVGDACSADEDGDGVDSAMDNCPTTANADQADLDGDGQGDACDSDRDGDLVPDSQDRCPELRSPNQADTDSDGAGDLCDEDDDNDAVADAADNCPITNNPDQADADGDMIGDVCDPTPEPPAKQEEEGCGCVSVGAPQRRLPLVPGALSAFGLLSLLSLRRRRTTAAG